MLRLKRLRKGQLSTYAIYPPECWLNGEIGRFNLSTELGRVKARSHKEAVELARAQGIGAGLEIFAVEVPDTERVIYQISAPHPAGSENAKDNIIYRKPDEPMANIVITGEDAGTPAGTAHTGDAGQQN